MLSNECVYVYVHGMENILSFVVCLREPRLFTLPLFQFSIKWPHLRSHSVLLVNNTCLKSIYQYFDRKYFYFCSLLFLPLFIHIMFLLFIFGLFLFHFCFFHFFLSFTFLILYNFFFCFFFFIIPFSYDFLVYLSYIKR